MFASPKRVIGLVVSLVILYFIVSFFIPSIKGLPLYIKDEVNKKVPDEVLMASAKQEVEGYQSKISDYQVKVEALSGKKIGYQNKIDTISSEVEDFKEGLDIGQNLLKSEEAVFMIKGQEYSRAEIEEDVERRSQMIKKLELEKGMYRDCLVKVEQVQKDGFSKVSEMRRAVVEMGNGMALLEIRMMKAQLEADLNKTLSLLNHDFDGNSNYSKTMEEINRRVRYQEIQNDMTGKDSNGLVPLTQ